ncbi:phosphodiester glycosidase family protein [uncultured Kordia sp.]|uniref:phosphodiester glycosidase family protein n=1 Tax=uncultured Kordia sp. TaxID=507699 RepID=UPI002633B98D|nr:phosphodiester glycosidase family protein [uncultured Kordia sp.]
MTFKKLYLILLTISTGIISCTKESPKKQYDTTRILAYEVNPKKAQLHFYWKNEQGQIYGNAKNLKTQLQANKQELIFAMNGGMYKKDQSPQGLYIEKGKILAPLDRKEEGYGNFYLQPNGIFYITKDNVATICITDSLNTAIRSIKYATQSGPMLVIDGKLHAKLTKGSKNLNIRNGVGVLPNGNLLFAMSKEKINFYDFATYFKENGCQNALYLDGFVSKTYLPEKKYEQMDGNFGVIIGAIKTN